MGKRTARKNYTTPNKQAAQNVKRVHVNDPSRKKAPLHDSVKKATRSRLAAKQATANNTTFTGAEAPLK